MSLLEHKEQILEDYRQIMVWCLMKFGYLSQEGSLDLIDKSGILECTTEIQLGTICHEEPYFWAMVLLHPENHDWDRNVNLWPPPQSYQDFLNSYYPATS